ncbi:hypothetical protein V6N11_010860 [Hibiscus sabdariffa]|uniref:RNase H type-1 domain-containing protein n=1 Tax=Hibiscus sabdariffa TaxID=183260 RepID=A0ABR2S6Q3_9ROSI
MEFLKSIGYFDSTFAELLAINEVLELSTKTSWVSSKQIVIEINCSNAISWLIQHVPCPFAFKGLVLKCLDVVEDITVHSSWVDSLTVSSCSRTNLCAFKEMVMDVLQVNRDRSWDLGIISCRWRSPLLNDDGDSGWMDSEVEPSNALLQAGMFCRICYSVFDISIYVGLGCYGGVVCWYLPYLCLIIEERCCLGLVSLMMSNDESEEEDSKLWAAAEDNCEEENLALLLRVSLRMTALLLDGDRRYIAEKKI